MANDEELEKGIRNLEEILQRLDDRAKNIQWVKENALPEAPARIKEAIVENFQQPKAVAPPAEPPTPAPAPEPVQVPAIAAPPVEIPPLVPEPAPAAEPPAVTPEPVKLPEPVVMLPEKATPPPLELEPVIKPAKKAFNFKSVLIFFCLGLAIAGGAYYQLTVNSAKARYAQAGALVKIARNAEAISAYTRIIEIYKGSPEAAYSQFAIGEIKSVQGNLTEAIDRYEKFLLAAPAGDARIPQAKFAIAEIEFKQNNFPDAEFMYNNADLQASAYAEQAADRIRRIKIINAQVAGARRLITRDPAKAVKDFSAALMAYPGLKAAAAGLAEAQKALVAANTRKADRAAAPAARVITARAAKAAPAKTERPVVHTAIYSKERLDACNAVWMMEKMQVRPDEATAAAGQNNDCAALKDHLAACKALQGEYKAMQNLKPAARALIEQETNPDWTEEKQTEQDKKTLKSYEYHHCAELTPTFAR